MKQETVIIRLTKQEKEELKARSEALHISMSALVRMKTLSK
jgi:hypothetical protein|tara:strand:+ start:1165 stop:1287 length:123 start_codon:yes stop_codon:yes gene_type:complete